MPTVFLVEDDDDLRIALDALLRSEGFRVAGFGSAEEFRASGMLAMPGCLLLDVRLPRQSGLGLQADLVAAGVETPVIFMSGHADERLVARAINDGALAFLMKPVPPQDLIDAVRLGLARDAALRGG